MILDSHIHFWKYHPVRDAWITDDMKVIQRDFLPEDALPVFNANGVAGCVAVQADQSPEENRFLLQLAAENDFIKGVVGWIDLSSPDIEEELESYKNHAKIKGFRYMVQDEAQGFLQRETVLENIAKLEHYGYTYDILIQGHQLADAITLTEKLPNQPYILDHCAKPSLRTGNITEWKAQIKLLAQNPNVYCKLSGLLTEDHWHNCNEAQLKDCMDVVLDSFGTNRVVFGSDWPVVQLAGTYTRWLNLVKTHIAHFSPAQQENILYHNAVKFYGL